MKKSVVVTAFICLLFALAVTEALADPIALQATLTADNHYALYYGTPTGSTFVGRNELGDLGDPYVAPYTNNWSLPETFNFVTAPGDYLYIAAWSDHATGQGLIGQFEIDGLTAVTKAQDWQVAFTGINLGNGSPAPSEAGLLAQLAVAYWQSIGYSLPQGSEPWASFQPGGLIPGINPEADWIWGTPLATNFDQTAATEYHIYRYPVSPILVPEPATFLLIGSGLVGLLTKRSSRHPR
jgi:hypothetical protein